MLSFRQIVLSHVCRVCLFVSFPKTITVWYSIFQLALEFD